MENLNESQFRRFWEENIMYLAFKFVLNENQSGWLTTLYNYNYTVYNYTFKTFLLLPF